MSPRPHVVAPLLSFPVRGGHLHLAQRAFAAGVSRVPQRRAVSSRSVIVSAGTWGFLGLCPCGWDDAGPPCIPLADLSGATLEEVCNKLQFG